MRTPNGEKTIPTDTAVDVEAAAALAIYTFGRCEIRLRGECLSEAGWRDPKDLECLLALASLGGWQVPRADIAELLWPQWDDEAVVNEWYATVHGLQAVLGRAAPRGSALVTLGDGRLSLHPSLCWTDCGAFEDAVRRAQRLLLLGRTESARIELEAARGVYRGPFLAATHGVSWINARRDVFAARYAWVERQLAYA